MHFREKRYDWLKKQRKSGIFQARILEWVQFNDMKFKTQDHKGYQGGHIHNPVPSGSKSRGKNSHHLRAAGESLSSLKINVFPGTWRKRGGIEKNLDLEDICWDLILSSSWHPERVLITGRSGDGIRKDEQRCGCGWESSGWRLSWESWSMCGDCHGYRWGFCGMSSDGLWQGVMEKWWIREWGLQTCFISHQGTWVHSSPADGSKTFFQGVVLVQF